LNCAVQLFPWLGDHTMAQKNDHVLSRGYQFWGKHNPYKRVLNGYRAD
jgi:hypothetical protein